MEKANLETRKSVLKSIMEHIKKPNNSKDIQHS